MSLGKLAFFFAYTDDWKVIPCEFLIKPSFVLSLKMSPCLVWVRVCFIKLLEMRNLEFQVLYLAGVHRVIGGSTGKRRYTISNRLQVASC